MLQPDQSLPVAIGEVVAGKYRIDRVLGRGGMGVVVAATHIDLDEPRAIKFMVAEARANEQAEQRFRREAKASAKLRSEHVVRVHDIGRLETGEPYLVMEQLEGEDLKRAMKRLGVPSVEVAVDHILQAIEALAEAHSAGIIHRDLKPSNLFVTNGMDGRPCVKLLDFGVSKLTGALAEAQGMDLTNTSMLLGSPLYMSPEQMASTRDIDARSDIWSLGVILYEMLTGKKPFRGKTVTSVTMSVATEAPKSPEEIRAHIPPALGAVVMRALRKDRDERYADVGALASALAPFASPDSKALLDRIARMRRQSSSGLDSVPSQPGPPSSSPGSFSGTGSSSSSDPESSISTDLSLPSQPRVRPVASLIKGADAGEPGASTEAGWGTMGSINLPLRRGRRWLVGIVSGLGIGLIVGVIAFKEKEPTAVAQPAATAEATPEPEVTASSPASSVAAPTPAPPAAPTPSVEPEPPRPTPVPFQPPQPVVQPPPVPAPAPPPLPAPKAKPKDPFGETWR